MRLDYSPDRCPVRVGIAAASPKEQGFEARFTGFAVRHFPDARRAARLTRRG